MDVKICKKPDSVNVNEELNKLKSTIAKEANNVLVDLPFFIGRNLTVKDWEIYCDKGLDDFLTRISNEMGCMRMIDLNDAIHFYSYVMYAITDRIDEDKIRNINCFLNGTVGDIVFHRKMQ